jgi:hypothetical protein
MTNLSKHIIVVTLLLVAIVATSFVNKQNEKKNELTKVEHINTLIKLRELTKPKSVFEVADSICQVVGVPYELVKEIGYNESGWRYIRNTNGGTDHGDLQVIDPTYWAYYNKLGLSGGKTRRNYLKVAIYYLNDCYNIYGSWKKARFAYGRGRWRDESTWTCLEEKFMGKIDWSKYDK